ncbi:hypothetical protein CSUI_011399, partial [Cystoisospora suis]
GADVSSVEVTRRDVYGSRFVETFRNAEDVNLETLGVVKSPNATPASPFSSSSNRKERTHTKVLLVFVGERPATSGIDQMDFLQQHTSIQSIIDGGHRAASF